MKRILSLFLIIVMICSCLAACNNPQVDKDTNSSQQETTSQVKPETNNTNDEQNTEEQDEWKDVFKNAAYSFAQTSFIIDYTSGAQACMYQDDFNVYMDIENDTEKHGIMLTKDNEVFYNTFDSNKNEIWYKTNNVKVGEGQEFITEKNGFNISYISDAFSNMQSLKLLGYQDGVATIEIFFFPNDIKDPSQDDLESLIVKIDIESKDIYQVESSINGMVMTFVECNDVKNELSFEQPTKSIDFQEAMNKFTSAFVRLS